VILLIALSIFYFESSKPKVGEFKGDSDINVSGKTSNILEAGDRQLIIENKRAKYEVAKELVEPQGYINIDYINITDQIGKNIVLVDFWTYSCINCQRTFPYLNDWYEKYGDEGLVIIGVHTPEFEFEKDYENVVRAVEKYGIEYPVVQDNDFQTWRSYNNRYWPRKYIIDIDGFIVYDHIGEGGYLNTENKIQELLVERNEVLEISKTIEEEISNFTGAPDFTSIKTSEVYFGYNFERSQMGNSEGFVPDETINYVIDKPQEELEDNKFYLEGEWKNNEGDMELIGEEGKVVLKYESKIINVVAGSNLVKEIEVFIDGENKGKIEVSDFDLYKLFEDDSYSEHYIELIIPMGVRVYTFTFG